MRPPTHLPLPDLHVPFSLPSPPPAYLLLRCSLLPLFPRLSPRLFPRLSPRLSSRLSSCCSSRRSPRLSPRRSPPLFLRTPPACPFASPFLPPLPLPSYLHSFRILFVPLRYDDDSDGNEDEAVVDDRLWGGAFSEGWRMHIRHAKRDGHYYYVSPAGLPAICCPSSPLDEIYCSTGCDDILACSGGLFLLSRVASKPARLVIL